MRSLLFILVLLNAATFVEGIRTLMRCFEYSKFSECNVYPLVLWYHAMLYLHAGTNNHTTLYLSMASASYLFVFVHCM